MKVVQLLRPNPEIDRANAQGNAPGSNCMPGTVLVEVSAAALFRTDL